MTIDTTITRRRFIVSTAAVGGGLALGFHLPAFREAAAIAPKRKKDETAEANEVTAWVVIAPDDSVTIRVAQSEMGQAVLTSMAMIIAEELECDWGKVRAEFASANRSLRENNVYRRMATGGSRAVRESRQYLQEAGASARARLIAAAAAQWDVAPDECRAESGMVIHDGSGRKINFGAVASAAAAVELDAEPAIKTPDQYRLLGTSVPRLDTAEKVDGSAQFGIDVRLPDMVYAAVKTCPVFGGSLAGYDYAAIEGRPGVIAAVEVPDGVAVVADSYWRAKTALDAMPIEWDYGRNADVSSESDRRAFVAALDEPGAVARDEGDVEQGLVDAATVLDALYEAPLLAHATMEPMSCVARVTDERVDVWVGTQNPEGAIAVASEVAVMPPDSVHCHTCFLGGGFGRRFYNDDVRQAVTIAVAVGRPVKLIWSREEDIQHDFYRPPAVLKFRAGLNGDGMPVAWQAKTVTPSLFATFRPAAIVNGVDPTSVEGLSNMPYAVANQHVAFVRRETHVPTAFWRSVGSSQNAFAVECFLDECAHAAGRDPYEYRRELLAGHSDWLAVLDTVAEKSDWNKPLPEGRARGIAIHESFGSIVGQVAEVALSKSGELRVERVVAAIDCGHVVNPVHVEMQMESAIVYGLTAALYGEITIEQGRVVQSNFHDYEMMHIDEMPVVETYFALSGGDKWGGVGEPGTPPIAPAVCNAIFTISGKRIRSLPLKNKDLSWT